MIENLRVGEYTISEVVGEDAGKYILPDDKVVELKAGETLVVEMHNGLISEQTENPNTGEPSRLPLLYIAFAAGAGILLVLLCHRRKKSN